MGLAAELTSQMNNRCDHRVALLSNYKRVNAFNAAIESDSRNLAVDWFFPIDGQCLKPFLGEVIQPLPNDQETLHVHNAEYIDLLDEISNCDAVSGARIGGRSPIARISTTDTVTTSSQAWAKCQPVEPVPAPEQRRATDEPSARVALDAAARRRVKQTVRRRTHRIDDNALEVRIPQRRSPAHHDGCALRNVNDQRDAGGGEVVCLATIHPLSRNNSNLNTNSDIGRF